MACVPFLAWVLGRSSRGRSPMRCYSVSRNTRSGSWRWWSDASTSGSSPTGTTRTPCPDSSRRPRSSPVRSSSQCWQFSRYFLDNQTIYPRTPNFVWLSWISVSKNKSTCILYIGQLLVFLWTKEAQKFTCQKFQPTLAVFPGILMVTQSLMLLIYLEVPGLS